MLEKQGCDMFLCCLTCNSAAHSASFWHRLPELHLLWPCQGHIMTLKDLLLYGGHSLTLFRLQADPTWAFSALEDRTALLIQNYKTYYHAQGIISDSFLCEQSFCLTQKIERNTCISSEYRQRQAIEGAACKDYTDTLWWFESCLKLWPV